MMPATLDPTGSYSERQFDRVRGFRLLAHAEIEACIEDLAMSAINSAYKAWKTDRKPRQCLLSLVAYHDASLGAVPETIQNGGSTTPLRERIDVARKDYVAWVRGKNHGVRERNLLKILLPVGVLESDLDSAWLQIMDSFGEDRGRLAHSARQIQQPPDPSDELRTIAAIVAGVKRLDICLQALEK